MIRAVVGYALAEDAIGLARFREKYAPLMSGDTDRLAFDPASKPAAASSAEFAAIAKMAASVDTLDGFIREMKIRFPDATARAPLPDPVTTGSLPETGREAVKRDPVAALAGDHRRQAGGRGAIARPTFVPSTAARPMGKLRQIKTPSSEAGTISR